MSQQIKPPTVSSAARGIESSDSPGALRVANAAVLTAILSVPSSLFFRQLMILNDLWAGWLTMWLMLVPGLFGLSWLVVTLFGAGLQERLLKILVAVLLALIAYRISWYAFLTLGYAFGLELETADRLARALTIVGFCIGLALLAGKRLPPSLPSLSSVMLALISFALITVGLMGIGLPAAEAAPIIGKRFYASLSVGLATSMTWFLASRGVFRRDSGRILQFASRWLATTVGSILLAVVGLELAFGVPLRLEPVEDLVVFVLSRGLVFVFLASGLWLLATWRLKTGFVWLAAAGVCATSVYLGYSASMDRIRLADLDDKARWARSSLFRMDFDDAVSRWQEIVGGRKAALPDDHDLVAEALVGLGEALHGVGRSHEAIGLLEEVLEIAESGGADSTLDPALVRARLVMAYRQVGRVQEADSLLEELDVGDFVRMLDRPENSVDLVVEVAEGYRLSGRFEDAEMLFRKTLDAIEEAKLWEFMPTIQALKGLSRILVVTARQDEALESIARLRTMLGSSNFPVHRSEIYRLQAEIRSLNGDDGKAVELQREALKLCSDTLGEDNPETAAVLGELGGYLLEAGKRRDALTACQDARDILSGHYPRESPEVVKAEFELAKVYAAVGRHAEAAALLETCIGRWRSQFGDGYHLIPDALQAQAGVAAETGDHAAASVFFARALDAQISGFKAVFPVLSGPQQVAALERLHKRFSEYLVHTAHHRGDDRRTVRGCFGVWLQIKGLMLDVQRARGEMLARSSSAETREILDQLRSVDARLAELWFRGGVDQRSREAGKDLRATKAELEQRLHALLAESGFWTHSTVVSIEDLQEAMPYDASYVDYCRVRTANGMERYLAFVLLNHGDPRLVDVGPALTLDGRVVDFLVMVGLGLDRTSAGSRIHDLAYDAIFLPLTPHLGRSRVLLISPDSLLARMPFSAIRDRSGSYLEDRFQISYLSNGRDVAVWDSPYSRKHSAILFADPDFDTLPPIAEDGPEPAGGWRSRGAWSNPPFRRVRIERLPGTLREAKAITALLEDKTTLNVLLFTGSSASEESLAFAESPWLMHFATHGYSVPKLSSTESPDTTLMERARGKVRRVTPDDNPLVRAGLALAGANEAFRQMSPRGVLTLDEIMSMPLVDTEMVVVSACDSGVGDAREGEGVFGVGRAFLAAGSRSVVVTLWSVPDEPTARLMEDFYSRWLSGESKAEALRNARSALRRRYPSPAVWAPFILVGDPS